MATEGNVGIAGKTQSAGAQKLLQATAGQKSLLLLSTANVVADGESCKHSAKHSACSGGHGGLKWYGTNDTATDKT